MLHYIGINYNLIIYYILFILILLHILLLINPYIYYIKPYTLLYIYTNFLIIELIYKLYNINIMYNNL